MERAFAYLRVSGKGQVEGDGFPRQVAEIEACAKARGLEIVRTFDERGVRGATEWEDRPAWSEMAAALMTEDVKVVVVESLNRLARELFIQEYILRDLGKRGVKLISAREQDIDSSPERILFRQIMGAIAQYDKTMIVMKLRGARKRAKAAAPDGRCEGRKPYGYRYGEQEVIARILAMHSLGIGVNEIANDLNHNPTMQPRKGRQWWPSTVSSILNREAAAQ